MKKNLFLNKKYLVKWTEAENAFLVQSPFNENAGFWWSKKWYQTSKYPEYFATGIVFERDYEEIIYSVKGIQQIKRIKGKDLYNEFQVMITKNKNKYLAMALATALKLKKMNDKEIVPQTYQMQKEIPEKLTY